MRNPFIIVFVLIAIVLGFTLVNGSSTQKEQSPEVVNTEEATPADSTTGVNEGTQEEEAVGSDAGMEFPVPDAGDVPEMIVVDEAVKVFNVSGENFAFDVKEMRVKEGDTVTINFTSADGFHDLVIDEFNARTEREQTGGTSSVTFVASKAGTFEYYCSVGQHRVNGMVGNLIVE
jgi:plastocyanin